MSKPFDATTKQLVALRPGDWLRFFELPGDSAEVIDADLSTVTASADRLLRVTSPVSYIVPIEFKAGKEATHRPERLLRYNVLIGYEQELPVRTVLVLLRPEADSRRILTGSLTRGLPESDPYLTFTYQVVRVWEQPVEAILSGGVTMLPFALLAAGAESDLPQVVRRMEARIAAETSENEAAELWVSTFILAGLKYAPGVAAQLLKGVRQMKESSTYQMILAEGEAKGEAKGKAEGKIEEAQSLLLRLGGKRLGTPSEETTASIAAIRSVERLEELIERVLTAESWEELSVSA